MKQLIRKLRRDHPNLVFTVGEAHCWSPQHNQIFYAAVDEQIDIASLLHELGHARLGHQNFTSDVELLTKEVDAWQEAMRLAKQYGVEINQEHVQDCLDTYRDWLFRRSQCPKCRGTGIQQAARDYTCPNCSTNWGVTTSRLRRPYRLQASHKNKLER